MSEFLSILALYYACDQVAAVQTLTHGEVMDCMAHYDAVKTYFADPSAEGTEGAQQAYQGFKDWERRNPAIVAELRGRAQH